MNTNKFWFWFVSNSHTSKSDFRSCWNGILFCVKLHCYIFPALIIMLLFEMNILTSSALHLPYAVKHFQHFLWLIISSSNKSNSTSSRFKGRLFIYIFNTEMSKYQALWYFIFLVPCKRKNILVDFMWSLWFVSTYCLRSVRWDLDLEFIFPLTIRTCFIQQHIMI